MIGRSRAVEIGAFVLLGGALGALVSWVPSAVSTSLAVLALIALPLVAWIAWRLSPEDARFLVPTFLAAVAVRAAVAILIEFGAPDGYFALDERIYENAGRELAEGWAGPAGFAGTEVVRRGYQVWNALIFSVVGFVPLAPTLANAAIGGASVILVYRISEPLAGVAAARISALLAAFFPSLVLWSSLNLKDAFAILSILVALRGAQRLAERIEPQGAAMLAAGILGLAQLRGYLVVLLVASTAVAVLLPRVRGASAPAVLTAWLALCALSVALPGRIESLAERPTLEVLGEHRRNLALGASAYHGDVDISTPGAAAKFLPVGLAYFLLAPAPWQLLNARQLLTLPEMLTWYALLPQVFFGLRHTLRRRLGAGLGIATFACLATVSYALVESNLGTAYRHRAQVLTLYLIFAAVGIATRHARRARARPPRAREPAIA